MIQRFGVVHACLLFVALAALPASTVLAQLVDEEAVGKLTIGGGIGVLVPAMNEVNGNIDIVNPFLRRDEIQKLSHINEGLWTHLDVRYRLGQTPPEEPEDGVSFRDRLSVGFAWGALAGRSQLDNVTRVSVRFFTRATTYYPYILYHLPFMEASQPRVQFVVGGGPVFLRSGYVEWFVRDRTSNIFVVDGDISELAGRAVATGSATGLTLQGGASYMLSSRFSVSFDTGYRMAKMTNLNLEEAVGHDSRFPPPVDPDAPDPVRRLGDWSVIDFFMRDANASYNGTKRTDPEVDGGCESCPLYYDGGDLEVDFSGPFATFTFRIHF